MTTKNNPDIDQLTKALDTIVGDLMSNRGFAMSIPDVWGAANAGKRLAGVDGAGKEVLKRFLSNLVKDHPEVIDIAFAGMSDVAKARIRKMAGEPEMKEAEKA